jgi:hypothetical protein
MADFCFSNFGHNNQSQTDDIYKWSPIKAFIGKALIFGSAPSDELESALINLRFEIMKRFDKFVEILNSGRYKLLKVN